MPNLKRAGLFLLVIPMAFLAGCAKSVSDQAYQRIFRDNGLIAYVPPQGDPRNKYDWNKFGPGAVLKHKDYSYEQRASDIIGEKLVKDEVDEAKLPDSEPNHATSSVFKPLDRTTVSGYNVDATGGYTFDAVNKASAALNLKRDGEVKITFGETRLVNPLSVGELRTLVASKAAAIDPRTRKNLRSGRSAVIWAAVYSKGMKFSFYRRDERGASVKLDLTGQQVAALKAQGYRADTHGVEISSPTFIAYRPLEDVASVLPRR